MTLHQYIYRVLRENEDPKQGLVARDPTAKIEVVQHILGNRKSQFISTTATLEAAEMFFGWVKKIFPKQKIRMVKIDVDELKKEKDVTIIDLTDAKILETHLQERAKMARNWARKYKEVLVEGKIPAHCVTLMEEYSYYPQSEKIVSLVVFLVCALLLFSIIKLQPVAKQNAVMSLINTCFVVKLQLSFMEK